MLALTIGTSFAATPSDPPTITSVTPGINNLTVAFNPPANDGGSAIYNYTATCGSSYADAAASPIVVSGLSGATAVTCTMKASNGVGTSAMSAPSAAVTPLTANATLYFESQAGDYIGAGRSILITPADFYSVSAKIYSAMNGSYSNGIWVRLFAPISYSPKGDWWDLNFVGPDNQRPVVGSYSNATRWPFQVAGVAGLDFGGDGRGCNQSSGKFQVIELTFDANDNVASLAVNFEQHCEFMQPGLFGQLRYNSSVPVDTARRHVLPLNLPPVIDAALSTVVLSSPASILGIDVPVPISITGGEYSIDAGAFTSTPGTVTNGQSVRVRLTSAATPNTLATATLDIGGASFPFKVGTAAGFTPQPNNAPLVVIVGQPASLSGTATTRVLSPATMASVNMSGATYPPAGVTGQVSSPASYSINAYFYGVANGPLTVGTYANVTQGWSSTSGAMSYYSDISCSSSNGTVTRFTVLEVEYLPSGAPSKLAIDFVQTCPAYSYVGYSSVYGYIRVNSNVPIDYTMRTPVPFKFPLVTGVAPGTSITSATATIAGINVPIAVSVSGGEYSIDGGAFTTAPGTIVNGQTVRVRLTSAAAANTLVTANLTLGDTVVPFAVGTAFGLNPQPGNGSMVALFGYPNPPGTPKTTRYLTPAAGATFQYTVGSYSGYGPITVSVSDSPTSNTGWSATLSGPNNTALAAATYTDAVVNTSAVAATFQSSGGPDCIGSGATRATMVVREVEYPTLSVPLKLAVDFVQRCNSTYSYSAADVIGFIRINSTVPIDYTITLPAPFLFPNVVGAVPGTAVASAAATLDGITVAVPISVTGGEYNIDGGPFTAAPGMVMAGQTVRVRVMAPAQSNAVTTANLTVGARTVPFSVGTAPDAAQQPNGSPLVVLVGVTPADGVKAPVVFSPATFTDVSFLAPAYTGQPGGIAAAGPSVNWQALMSGPNNALLYATTYIGAGNANSTAGPFFSMSSYATPALDGLFCSYVIQSTDFTVHEVEYAVSSTLLKLAMDFQIRCMSGQSVGTTVHGYVRVNSNVPIDYTLRKPLPFQFTQAVGAAPGAVIEANEIIVKGINVPVPVSVTGGEYSIDGGAYTATNGTISAGQRLKVRATASVQFNAVVTAQVSVGEVSAEFKVGTQPGANPQPNGAPLVYLISQGAETLGNGGTFVFSAAAGSSFSVSRAGNTATLFAAAPSPFPYTGDSWQFGFSAADGSLLVPGAYNMVARNASAATGAAGLTVTHNNYSSCSTITGQFNVLEIAYSANGIDKLAIDFVHYCAGNPNPLFGYVRFNSNIAVSTVTDTTPTPFYFASVNGAARSTTVVSSPVTILGYTTPATISIVGGEYSIDNGAFTSAASTISPGQSVRVRLATSTQFGTSTAATLTVGGVAGLFTAYTEFADFYPDPIVFGFVPNTPLSQWIYSPIVTVTGINAPVVVTINGGEFSVGGRPFTSAPSGIQPGETIQVRLMSSAAYYDYRVSLLTVGSYTAQFSIQTLAQVGLNTIVIGAGNVTSSPAAINCPGICASTFVYGTSVTLLATPWPGMQFNGWSGGGCSGTGTCTVTTNADVTVTASFTSAPPAAPVIVAAIPGNGQATLLFTLPPAPGAQPVTSFTATCGGITKSAPSSPITLTGLTNGTTYSCTVVATNVAGPGPASAGVDVTPSSMVAAALIGVQSRKTHGAAGVYDLPIDVNPPITGAVTVEPRVLGGGHQIVFQFNTDISSASYAVVDGSGATVTPSAFTMNANEVTLQFATLPDKTRLNVSLSAINGTLAATASVGFLAGDVNNTRSVTATDLSAVKARSGQPVNGANYVYNVGLSGNIGARDAIIVKTRMNNAL